MTEDPAGRYSGDATLQDVQVGSGTGVQRLRPAQASAFMHLAAEHSGAVEVPNSGWAGVTHPSQNCDWFQNWGFRGLLSVTSASNDPAN